MSELISFKRRLIVLEADDTSEKKSLNLMRPSMLWPTTVIIPAMLAVAAIASMAGLSLPLRDRSKRQHDDGLTYQMGKDKALHMRINEYIYIHKYKKQKKIDVALQALPRLIPFLGSTDPPRHYTNIGPVLKTELAMTG